MRVIVTAGPTREYIDTVRFISNASSGLMGYSIAAAAIGAGHDVTLLTGKVSLPIPTGCVAVPFVSVDDLTGELGRRFDACDVLVMTAAVGDFRVEKPFDRKLSRKGGPVALTLIPTNDVLASVAARKRQGQRIIAFAVEEGTPEQMEAKARTELADKHADLVVVNTPAAMAVNESLAAVLSPTETLLPWARRPKKELAAEIVTRLIG